MSFPFRAESETPGEPSSTAERRTQSQVRLKIPGRADDEAHFEVALREVRNDPESELAWRELEQECERAANPDPVAETYLRVLTPSLAPEVRRRLARAAYAFYGSWLGDDAQAMERLLRRVLELDPETDWALDELVARLTAADRWDALLEAYDLSLSGELPPERRVRLLDEAAHAAKDFADRPERAIGYLRELSELDPRAGALALSVARMLQERALWQPLIELLQIQAGMSDAPGAVLRLQIAELYLERLADPTHALQYASEVLESRPGDEAACALLDRILALEDVSSALRSVALAELRRHHELAGRYAATIAALETALPFADGAQEDALLRELAERLLTHGENRRAQTRYAELLLRAPGDAHVLTQLERLAERTGDHEAHALALEQASLASDQPSLTAALILAAMRVRSTSLAQRGPTLALGQRLLALSGAQAVQRREAALLMDGWLRDGEGNAERLSVLDILCETERDPAAQKLLLAETARVARAAGQRARALSAWDARLDLDSTDLEALGAVIELAGELSLYAVQIARLAQRAGQAPTQSQRRQDLVRVAELQASVLERPDAAIETWFAVRDEFGDAGDVLGALDHLLRQQHKFAVLARVYEGVTGQEHVDCVENLCGLGDLYRCQLANIPGAILCYVRALELAPDCESARSGLSALLGGGGGEHSLKITTALARSYEATDDWQLCVALLDARVSASDCTKTQARLMLEVAELCELRACDAGAALSLVGKALTRSPFDGHAERELLRLADVTGHHREASAALDWAAAICADRERAADLRTHEARLLERIGDHAAAARTYAEVLKVRPESRIEAHALVRCAAQAGAFQLACEATLRSCQLRGVAEPEVLEALECAADQQAAFGPLCDAFATALESAGELSAPLGYALERRLAEWSLERCGELALAERALRRAVSYRPNCVEGLTRLADLQRRCQSPALVDTLLALDACEAHTIEPLEEAAQLAVALGFEPEQRRELLRRLYRRASSLCATAASQHAVRRDVLAKCLAWTLGQLVPLELSLSGGGAAAHLLDDASRLPLQDRERAQFGVQCAHVLARQGDLSEALRSGLTALDRAADDLELVRWLAELAAQLQRVPDQLALRKQELALSREPARRLALRLEVARLAGLLESQDGRFFMLTANLRESPGHPASIEAAGDLLVERGRFAELSALLSEQADALDHAGEHERATVLWRRAAQIAEQNLHDLQQAIHAHTRIVARASEADSIEELVRLSEQAGDPIQTAFWLARQIELADAQARPGLYVRMAREQLAAERFDDAIETLRSGFDRHPEDGALRMLLIERLRAVGRERDLAEVLAAAARVVDDQAQSLTLSREAARLLRATMHDPEALVESAERALELAPGDHELSMLLAEGLSTLGRHEGARQVLVHLLAMFGRRHSPERGLVHAKLSAVLREEGDLTGACAQLELALKMRSQDVEIMHALSELAGEAGELARRERALHALRLAAKRGPVRLAGDLILGAGEILLRLSDVARARGDASHAHSLRESALESLTLGDAECARIERYASERGDFETLELLLRKELSLEPRYVARAACLARLADVLDRKCADSEAALLLRLSAVELDAANPKLQAAALNAARKRGETARFRALLQGLLARARRPSDAYARCEVCLRLGEAWLEELAPDEAVKCYREAEATGVREGDVWRAQLRLALEIRDAQLQDELLARLASLGEAELQEEGRGEILYRMAEIRLASAETREEGIACLQEAVAFVPHPARVTRLLSRLLTQGSCDASLLALLSRLARACTEEGLLQMGELYAEHGDEAVLSALLAPLADDATAKSLAATLRTRRASRLLTAAPSSELARSLLLEALAASPGHLEAEDMLLSCFAVAGEHAQAIAYLMQRFEFVREGDADAAVRYALKLQAFPSAGETRLEVLRTAAQLCPERPELWHALWQGLIEPTAALERADAIDHLLALDGANDAGAAALEAADIYERAGDEAALVRVLSAARRTVPQHVEVQRRLIEACRAQNEPAALANLLEQLAGSEPDSTRAAKFWQEAAELWRNELDDLGATVAALTGAVAALPQLSCFHRQLGAALLTVGRDDDAIAEFGLAIERCNDQMERAELLRERGKALLDRGDLREGVNDLERTCELQPALLGVELLELAEDACRRAERLDAATARSTTLKLATIRRSRGELTEAAALLEASLERDPQDDEMLEQLADLYAELKRFEALARVSMTRMALHTGPALLASARRLSALVPQLADPQQALSVLAHAHTLWPESNELEQALIDAHSAVSDHSALVRLWIARSRRTEGKKERVDCLHQAAKHMLATGATPNALHMLQRIHSALPEHVEVTLTLAEILFSESRLAEARQLLEVAVARGSEVRPAQRALLLLLHSRVARVQGDRPAALSSILAAREADKNSHAILVELAVVAEALEAWHVAERALMALLMLKHCDLMPRGEVLLRRSRVALRLSGPAQALIWARKAQEATPDSEEIEALVAELRQATRDAANNETTVRF